MTNAVRNNNKPGRAKRLAPHKRASDLSPAVIAARGQRIYESRLKPVLEPQCNGQIVAIEVESGDYAVGPDLLAAADELQRNHADSTFYFIRVGSQAVFRLG